VRVPALSRTKPSGRARFRLTALALCAALVAMRVPAQTPDARSRDAMAFIRVAGDLTIDYHDARLPVVRKNVALGSGSGFVVAPSGLVLTSLHVVEVEATSRANGPELQLENKRVQVFVGRDGGVGAWEAHVVASDPERDLAALQVTAAELPYLPLGDSDAAEAGRPVQVLGFPFGRQTEVARRADADVIPQVSVIAGSLSATRADDAGETRFLQTDAAIQPGNSGGPMLDEDGYVMGVVKMKLARDASSSGAGFAVAVNEVKDFLEANGLIDRLPSVRLRPGVRNLFEWKQVAVDLPDGYTDRSPVRIQVDAGELGDVGFRVDRWETPWPATGLEEALLGGEAVRGFIPGPARPGPRLAREGPATITLASGRPPSLVGSGVGTDRAGRRFRVEYAIVDLGREKVVARYLGPADALAFNLGLLRRSLRSFEAGPLLFGTAQRAGALPVPLDPAPFANGEGAFVGPRGWSLEPATQAACEALPPADAGLLARHPADYTLVLRALRWRGSPQGLARALASCRPPGADASPGARAGYAFRFERLGVPVAVEAHAVRQDGDVLLLELEAPVAKLPAVEELYARWLEAARPKRGP